MSNRLIKDYTEAEKYTQTLNNKISCRVATNGSNITLAGTQTIDGIDLKIGDRVLVKDQNASSENGIYTCFTGGWHRAPDMDTSTKCRASSYVFIEEGTSNLNANKLFQLTTDNDIILESDGLEFDEYGTINITNGSGINVIDDDGNGDITLSVKVDDTTITFNGCGEVTAKTASITASATTLANGSQIYDFMTDYVTHNAVLLTTDQNVSGHKTFEDSMVINSSLEVNDGIHVHGDYSAINSNVINFQGATLNLYLTEKLNLGYYDTYINLRGTILEIDTSETTITSGDLIINSSTTHNGSMTVNGNVSINGSETRINSDELIINSSTTLNGNTTIHGNLEIDNYELNINSSTTHNGSLTVNGNVDINSSETTINSDELIINSSTTLNGSTSIDGIVDINGSKTTIISDELIINSSMSVNGSLTVNGNVDINSSSTTIDSDELTINSSMTTNGNVDINSSEITIDSDELTINSSTTLNGSTSIVGTVDISGSGTTIHSDELTINSSTTHNGSMTINGNVDINGSLITIHSDELIINSSTTLNGSTTIRGDLEIDNDEIVINSNELTINSSTTLNGSMTINGTVDISGSMTTIQSDELIINSSTTLNGNTTILGDLDIDNDEIVVNSNNFTINSSNTLNGSLTVNGNVDINGSMTTIHSDEITINSSTSLNGSTAIRGDLEIDNDEIVINSDELIINSSMALNGSMLTINSDELFINSSVTLTNNTTVRGNLEIDNNETTIRSSELTVHGDYSAINSDVINFQGATLNLYLTEKLNLGYYDTLTTVKGNLVINANTTINSSDLTINSSTTHNGSMIINGNVSINGSETRINSDDLIIKDPLIKIADGNTADNVDIGFYGEYVDGGITRYTGLIRDASKDEWFLFTDHTQNPADDNDIVNTNNTNLAVLGSNLDGGVYIRVKTTVALNKGECVYIKNTIGNGDIIVEKARSNSTTTMPSFGLATEAISANTYGYIITFGTIEQLTNTDFVQTGITLAPGDTCYISSSQAGKLTNVAPSGETNRIQNIGQVIRKTSNNKIILRVGGAGRTNATPALNNGNIFIGNSSNNSVSTSLLTALNDENVVFTIGSQTLTDKTLTNAILNGSVSGTAVLNENDMVSNSSTQVATQSSIKAYVDSQTYDNISNTNLLQALQDLESFNGSGTNENITIGASPGDTLFITGNLQVNGSTITVNSTEVTIEDKNIILGYGNTTADIIDGTGITLEGGTNSSDVTFQWASLGNRMELKQGASYSNMALNDIEVNGNVSGNVTGDVIGDVTGNLLGNASTATIATTAIDISGITRSENSNTILYINESNNYATASLTSFARTLLADNSSSLARTTLGVDLAGTDNSTNVTLTSVANNYLKIKDQEITASIVPTSLGGTGTTSLTQHGILTGNGTSAVNSNSNLTFNGSDLILTGDTTLNGSMTLNGSLNIGGNIIPNASNTYNLGSSDYRFKDLFLSGKTLHLGDTNISTNDSGDIEIMDNNENHRKLMVDEIILGNGSNRVSLRNVNDKLSISMRDSDGTGNASSMMLDVDEGGTGQSTFENGQLLIGNSSGNTLTKGTLIGDDNITITNGSGSITITGNYSVGDGGLTQKNFTTAFKNKLVLIEDGADVTDTGNVKSAGALMDSEVTNLAQVKAFNASHYATAAQGLLADSAQQQLSEGAFVDGDKTKLDGIEASADVTDTANVKAAGALMDSEVTNLAQVKAFNASDYATTAQGLLADSAQQQLSEGAFVDGDKTKLDGIEASADVTDTANVKAAGALMDSEVTNLAQVKAFNASHYATAAQGLLADSAQQQLSEGAFVDGDKTKLDGIEAGADVTDTGNVKAAGALMGSEVINLAQVKAFNASHYATAAQGLLADSAQQQLSEGAFVDGDKTKLNNIDDNANNYSLPLATNSSLGGVKIGYAQNNKNYPVELDLEKMYVNVSWTDTTYTEPQTVDHSNVSIVAGSGLTGGGDITSTRTLNIGASTGINVESDSISVDVSDFMANGSNNRILTATGTDSMHAESNFTFDGSELTLNGDMTLNGSMSLGGNIIPKDDIKYDLGSYDYRFKDLYLSGSSIHVGNTVISNNGDGHLQFTDIIDDSHKKIMVDEIILGTGEDRVSLSQGANNEFKIGTRGSDGLDNIQQSVLTTLDGGTGQSTFENGQLLIGNSSGNTLTKSTLTAGNNITITNSSGSITISSTDTNTTYIVGDGGLTEKNFTTAFKNKLVLIEDGADVTDTANVKAAGALMDSEVTNLAQVKAFNASDYATAAQGLLADSAQQPLSEGAFVDGDKTKLDGIATGATANTGTVTSVSGTGSVNGLTLSGTVTDSGSLTLGGSIPLATASASGLMSSSDKSKLTGITTGATSNTGTVTSVSGTGSVNGLTLSGTVTDSGSLTLGGSIPLATASASGLMSSTDKSKLAGIASGATANTGTVTSVSGTGSANGLTLSGTVTDSGSLTLGGSIPLATASASGLMSSSDKSKLTGIATGANNYSLPLATNSSLGGVKIGYAENGQNYPVELYSEKMYVNVPWTDNDTLYSSGSGISLSNGTFSVAGGDGLTQEASGLKINPDQTTVTSILNTGLVVGRDNDNQIKFSTDNKLIFRVNGGDNLTIGDGNMGIGTSNPTEKIEVYPGTHNSAVFGKAHIGYMGFTSDWTGFSHVDANSIGTYALLQHSDGTTILNAASGKFIDFRVNNNFGMRLNSQGNLVVGNIITDDKIGTTTDQEYISFSTINEVNTFVNDTEILSVKNLGVDITGNITATGDITAFSSDKRLKENIEFIKNPLEKIKVLSGFTYDWSIDKCEKAGFTPNEERQIGVFAQDVQSVIPEAVKPAPFDTVDGKSKSGDNYLTVQYEKIVPLLIECIKDQQSMIENLQGQINEIKSKII